LTDPFQEKQKKADQFFFNKYVRICFHALHEYARKRKHKREIKAEVLINIEFD